MKNWYVLAFFWGFASQLWAQSNSQDIALFRQFNGRYSFTLIGNTLNQAENNINQAFCSILSESSATLNLNADQQLIAAYLYWSGSGSVDPQIKLNGEAISADTSYSILHPTAYLPFFVARTDITDFVHAHGNGTYTFSDLDISAALQTYPYCSNRTNYAGWSIVVVYEQQSLPLNQLNVYDGFMAVPMEINIYLDSLNVIDNVGAQIGFIAWEGDSTLAINETLRFNGEVLSNPPLNPSNNAFNSTNTITGLNNLYNMDMDIYPIENFVQPGDTQAHIQLTSGAYSGTTVVGDVVFISTVVSVLNSQMPDASITIDLANGGCQTSPYQLPYTIGNFNATNPLPPVDVGVYVNGNLVDVFSTETTLAIDESLNGVYVLEYESDAIFEVFFVVDYNSQQIEINENNNKAGIQINPQSPPTPAAIADLTTCEEYDNSGTFHWGEAFVTYSAQSPYECQVYGNWEDAVNAENPMNSSSEWSTSRTVYLRAQQGECYTILPWNWRLTACLPELPNFLSLNEDGINDQWNAGEIVDRFPNAKVQIFNRWGKLVWAYKPNEREFKGIANQAGVWYGTYLPSGTYFVITELNHPDYPQPFQYFLYLTR